MSQSQLFARPDAPWTGRQAFEELVCSLFSDTAGLRRWLSLNSDMAAICDSLPAPPAPLREVVHQTTDVLLQHGFLEDSFFEQLLANFPKRRPSIEPVWKTWRQCRPSSATPCPRPGFLSAAMEDVSEALERALLRREALAIAGEDQSEVKIEIVRLQRELRQGPQLKPGDFLHHGRFHLVKTIGSGGFATVWLAYDREWHERVAVKVMHGHVSQDLTRRERFERGARSMARMPHRNIARVVLTKFEDGGYHAYVMEYAGGGDLRKRAIEGALSEQTIIEIFIQVCEGLSEAHSSGCIHRDIKPSNILLDVSGTPKLTDFDLIKSFDTTGGTWAGAGIGTPFYIAPETWANAEAASERSDIFSLGMTMLTCLLRRDMDIDTYIRPAHYIKALTISARLKQVIMRAVEQDPGNRPKSADDVCVMLREAARFAHEFLVDEIEASPAPEVLRFTQNRSRYLASDKWGRDLYRAADGRKLISIVLDDICRIHAGAVVCGVNQYGDSGILGRNIAAAGGPPHAPVHSHEFKLPPGIVFHAPGGGLASKHVLYVTQDDSSDDFEELLPAQIARIVARTLQGADDLGMRSIAYPLLLTGVAGLSRDRILSLIFETLHDALPAIEAVEEALIVVYPYSQAVGQQRRQPLPVIEGHHTDPPQPTASVKPASHPARKLPALRALETNTHLSFSGTKVQGLGFVLSNEDRKVLIDRDPRNAARIFPYLTGGDVAQATDQCSERYIINFGEMTLEAANQWPDLLQIVRERVKPERDRSTNRRIRECWWHLGASTQQLYRALRGKHRCLVNPHLSRHLFFASCPSDQIFADSLHVHAVESMSFFACVQSRVFTAWIRMVSSTLNNATRWDLEAFTTFPFPQSNPRADTLPLMNAGDRLCDARGAFMNTKQFGLVQTYNELKDPTATEPEILSLRALHVGLDREVLAAYGWTDIHVPPYTTPESRKERAAVRVFEDAVLERLAARNVAN